MKLIALHRALAGMCSILALCAAANASAQYIWLNEKGVKQYSDMPPPSSVPNGKILKQPGGRPVIEESPESSAPGRPSGEGIENSPASDKTRSPLTAAERNAEFKKRRMEQEEKEKKAAEQQQQAAEKAKNCERAQAYQRSLQSGERLMRTDKNGERYFLNEQQRSQEMQDNKRALDSCK